MMMELSHHTYRTEKVSSKICKYLKTRKREEITTCFHIDIVILLTPSCSSLEHLYPPCSGFHRLIQDTAHVLKQLGSLLYSKKLTSVKSLVVFEQKGVLCCQTLSCLETVDTNQWQIFEGETLTLLEQQIELVFIPYLQSGSYMNQRGVDFYDLLVLDCIHGGSSGMETTGEVCRRMLLITSSPAVIVPSSRNDENKVVNKLISRKGIVVDLVHVLSCTNSFEEQIPNSIIASCLFSGGSIWNSDNIQLISQIGSNQSHLLSSCNLQEWLGNYFSDENSVIANSQQWHYCGDWLGVFIQWHIQQGFQCNYDSFIQDRSELLSDTEYLSFSLLLDEWSLVACYIHIYNNNTREFSNSTWTECVCPTSNTCTTTTNNNNNNENYQPTLHFLVHLELRRRKDDDIKYPVPFRRWYNLLACEQLLFQSFSNPTIITTWLDQQADDWLKECPCLIFHVLGKPTGDDPRLSSMVERVKNLLLSLYPGSITCRDHSLVFNIQQSQYLMFYLIPVDSMKNAVKLITVGIGICVHQWKRYLDPLFMQEEYTLWSYHLESSCSFFLLESGKENWNAVESLNFAISNTEKIRIQLWEKTSHCWILPTLDSAYRVWQSFRHRLEKTMKWSTLREENVSRMMKNADVVNWWIGANYPSVVCLERKKNQVKLYYNHHYVEQERYALDVLSCTALACYYAMDVVLEWWQGQTLVVNTKPIVQVNDSLWRFAQVVVSNKVKSSLLAFFHVRSIILNTEWMTQTICQQGEWLALDSSDSKRWIHHLIGEQIGQAAEEECLTFVKRTNQHNKNTQGEWLIGMIIVMTQQEDPISLFILSLKPRDWQTQEETAKIQYDCRHEGSSIIQQIKKNILWSSFRVGIEINELWTEEEEMRKWKPVRRWSLNNSMKTESSEDMQLFYRMQSKWQHDAPYAMKCLLEMLSSCGYHQMQSSQESITWLRFEIEGEKKEELMVVAKVYRNDIQVWLELYDMANPHNSRYWKSWILFHEWIVKILEKYLQLYFSNYCCFSSWIDLNDMSTFCRECFYRVTLEEQSSWRETAKVIEWRHQNVWLLQWKHSDMSTLCSLELYAKTRQDWPMECLLSCHEIIKKKCLENVSFSQLFWSILTIEYLQGEYIVQKWNQSEIPEESSIISKWLVDEKNIHEKDRKLLFQFHQMEMEWKYKEISKMAFIEEWKRQLHEEKVKLYVHESSNQLTCIGLVTADQLQRIFFKTHQGTNENRDYWILFIVEMPQWKSNESSVVTRTMSLPLTSLSKFLSQKDNYTGKRISELLQEMEQNAEESKTLLSSWFSSLLFHLHQLQRWKVEIEICRSASSSSWNLELFMDAFPHYSLSELCRHHFTFFDNNTVKIPKLPSKNQLEWDKIVNPTSATFSDTFQLLRRNNPNEIHVWYLLMPSNQDDVVLLLHFPWKEEPNLELIMQNTDKANDALRTGCQFLRWLIGQVWNHCWEKWNNIRAKLH